MRRMWVVVATLSAVGLASARAWPSERSSPELGAGYSLVHSPDYSGWSVSWVKAHDRRVVIAVNAAGYYVEGSSAHFVGAGPQLRGRGEGAALFAQIVVGVALIGGDVLPGLVVYPGIGLDVRPRQRVGLRFQADWPALVVSGYGSLFTSQLPRFSAGVVFRPSL